MKKSKAILVNSLQTISLQRSLSYLMWMVLVRLQKKTLARLQSRWAGARNKVSYLIESKAVIWVVEELLVDLDPNHDGQITEEEFALIFKYI